jgi:hypothetical protein
MSIWTHVAAAIRFDAMRTLPDARARMHPVLGNTVSFTDDEQAWLKCDVPCGTEGSLQHTLWENPHLSSLSAYTATIFGDLRDYNNVGEIVEYLRRCTQDRFVRQGVAVIEVEGLPPEVWNYVDGDTGWVKAAVPNTEGAQ